MAALTTARAIGLLAAATVAAALTGRDEPCGHFGLCPNGTTCTLEEGTAGHVGRAFACAPSADAVVCRDARFSCPQGFECDVADESCKGPAAGADTRQKQPLVLNGQALPRNTSNSTSFCGLVAADLPARCNCTSLTLGGIISCKAVKLRSDAFDLEVDVDPCGVPAEVRLKVVEEEHGINYTVASEGAGKTMKVPIPGASIDIPVAGNVGLDAAIQVQGNADMLQLKVGLDACTEILGKSLCGSDLTRFLPFWVLKGNYSFGHFCNGTASSASVSTLPIVV